jgi:hypothetical protein
MAEPQEKKPNWPMAKADTPNDGLPENWFEVRTPPMVAGQPQPETSGPMAGPTGTGPYFAASIPPVMMLQTDLAVTGYPSGLGAYRVMPPGPNGSASSNAAAQSATSNK